MTATETLAAFGICGELFCRGPALLIDPVQQNQSAGRVDRVGLAGGGGVGIAALRFATDLLLAVSLRHWRLGAC